MSKFIRVKFEFEDNEKSRKHIADMLHDTSWLDSKKHPSLHIGIGMIEQEALSFIGRALEKDAHIVLGVQDVEPWSKEG